MSIKSKENRTGAVFISLIFGISQVLGHAVYKTNNLAAAFSKPGYAATALATFLVLSVAAYVLLYFVSKLVAKNGNGKADVSRVTVFMSSGKGMLVLWAVIFVC